MSVTIYRTIERAQAADAEGITRNPVWTISNPPVGGSIRDSRLTLRASPFQPVGWGIQIGIANPERNITLHEVIALCALPDRGNAWEFVEPHLKLISELQKWITDQGLLCRQTIDREVTNMVVDRLRDLIRLRREAYYARGAVSAQSDEEKRITDTLASMKSPLKP